ncbi:hypothetical protein TIFTF001_014999 [Ficus carica]|uniref:LOB domain-containing protein n=1 Tax=Ficus carica TaxID=3494 RepID=A0AA88AH11_FICCA|nr:hypothetical protein TIFTF001_014999 [Ficus carica]
MTLKGGTSQACAACKYQRRRCTAECPLAPYFPPDQPKLFQNAHKLFGVSNILKILKKLEPEQRATAMWSIIYQANERDRDPVHGCLGKICQLRYQIWHSEQELQSVHARIEMCCQQQQQQQQQQHQIPSNMPNHDQHVASQLELGMAPPSNELPLMNDHAAAQAYGVVPSLDVTQHEAYSNNNNAAYNSVVFVDSKDDGNVANPLWVQYPYGTTNNNDNNNNSSMAIPSQVIVSQPLDVQQQVVQDYDEMPFFMDDRQSFVDSKEAYDSSSEESVLKDTTQPLDHVADNELKSAAACFSLTSVTVSTDK